MKRMPDAEVADSHDGIARNGRPTLPLDLHEGDATLLVIRKEIEKAEEQAWLDRNGGPELPPGLQQGGLWLEVIRDEVTKALTAGAYVQVRRDPPPFLRLLLGRWLHFPASARSE